jgi:hypothetical protein
MRFLAIVVSHQRCRSACFGREQAMQFGNRGDSKLTRLTPDEPAYAPTG